MARMNPSERLVVVRAGSIFLVAILSFFVCTAVYGGRWLNATALLSFIVFFAWLPRFTLRKIKREKLT